MGEYQGYQKWQNRLRTGKSIITVNMLGKILSNTLKKKKIITQYEINIFFLRKTVLSSVLSTSLSEMTWRHNDHYYFVSHQIWSNLYLFLFLNIYRS